jgi:16S rRNA G966 N2-methylase RsmD
MGGICAVCPTVCPLKRSRTAEKIVLVEQDEAVFSIRTQHEETTTKPENSILTSHSHLKIRFKDHQRKEAELIYASRIWQFML